MASTWRVRAFQLLIVLVLVAATSAATAEATPATALTPAGVAPSQELATLLGPQQAMSQPSEGSTMLGMVPARRPITEERTVLPVLEHVTSAAGVDWLQVRLPGRPNSHSGWIRREATRSAKTSWHIVIRISRRRVTIYKNGRSMQSFKAVVGKPSTPTPRGEFFVEEVIQIGRSDVGAPFALALSARSNVIQEFAGGPGQIALHGLGNVGGVLGTAVSHGCVRLANSATHWLVLRIAPGIPVTIAG
jgi:lipoprotein-anchoring transpeptidase ErfK/SrfK